MEMKDEIRIEASVPAVYAALNDPAILMHCIPGCEELVKRSDTELAAKVALKIGPVKARFSGTVILDTDGAPDRFSLSGSGNGGIAGFAKGGAYVELRPDGETTILTYDASGEIGGKIAQLGSRLVDSTARKLAGEFFARLRETLETPASKEAMRA